MKKIQERKDCFVIARVTKSEKARVEKEAKEDKDVSAYIRRKLGLNG